MTENKTCRVGFAQHKITPSIGSELGGYFHKRFARDVKSDLYAKAMVIETCGRRVALVANDLLRTCAEYADPARAQIASACGIPPEAVMISATHTHTGPALQKDKGNPVDPVPGYMGIMTEAIVKVTRDACDSMFDATLHVGQAEAERYSMNKLSRTRNGRDVYRQPEPHDPETVGPAGPLDTSVQVLCARDADKRIRAMAVNFASHPNSGGDSIWAEWPGEMARTMAAIYGPDVPCLFLQGTAGDVDCRSIPREQIGRGIAGAAVMAIEREVAPMASSPIDFRLKLLKIARLVKTAETDRIIEAIRNKPDADYLEKSWPPRYDAWDNEPAELTVPIQCLRMGDIALVGLPCEAFTTLGLEIKRYSPAKRTFVVAYANDHVGYMPPVEQAERGGYGEWPFISRRLIPQAATLMTDAAIGMLHELWGGK